MLCKQARGGGLDFKMQQAVCVGRWWWEFFFSGGVFCGMDSGYYYRLACACACGADAGADAIASASAW